jgi:hypothetical protein
MDSVKTCLHVVILDPWTSLPNEEEEEEQNSAVKMAASATSIRDSVISVMTVVWRDGNDA